MKSNYKWPYNTLICSSDWYNCFSGPIPSYCYAGISRLCINIFFFLLCDLRGLVGYRSVFSSDTRGTGFMHRAFLSMIVLQHIFFFFRTSSVLVIRILEYRVFCLIYYTHLTFHIQISSFLHFSTHFSYFLAVVFLLILHMYLFLCSVWEIPWSPWKCQERSIGKSIFWLYLLINLSGF